MFRTMRRFKQELTREECLAVLRSQPRLTPLLISRSPAIGPVGRVNS